MRRAHALCYRSRGAAAVTAKLFVTHHDEFDLAHRKLLSIRSLCAVATESTLCLWYACVPAPAHWIYALFDCADKRRQRRQRRRRRRRAHVSRYQTFIRASVSSATIMRRKIYVRLLVAHTLTRKVGTQATLNRRPVAAICDHLGPTGAKVPRFFSMWPQHIVQFPEVFCAQNPSNRKVLWWLAALVAFAPFAGNHGLLCITFYDSITTHVYS